MRTAEEILAANYYHRGDPEIDFDSLVNIINDARIEAIKECAEKAQIKSYDSEFDGQSFDIDRQSILKLIKKLK